MKGTDASTREVTLSLVDIDDKYGFGDGDIFEDWVAEWAHQAWPHDLISSDHDHEHTLWTYIDDRRILIRIVVDRMVNRLSHAARSNVRVISTVHNPVRLCLDDATEPGEYRQIREELDQYTLTVTRDEIFALCDTMLPPRSAAWACLHESLCWEHALMEELRPSLLAHRREAAVELTDQLHTRLGDDGARLLSELLDTRGHGERQFGVTRNELADLARVAELCSRA